MDAFSEFDAISKDYPWPASRMTLPEPAVFQTESRIEFHHPLSENCGRSVRCLLRSISRIGRMCERVA